MSLHCLHEDKLATLLVYPGKEGARTIDLANAIQGRFQRRKDDPRTLENEAQQRSMTG